MSSSSLIDPRHLVQILRQRLVADLGAVLGELGGKVQDRLMHLMDERVDSNRLMHERRDAYQAYVRARNEWVSACSKALRQALVPPSEATKEKISAGQFQLIDNEVMENKILSSRLVLTLMETAGVEFADLKRRVQNLEDGRALADHDVLRPEVFCQILVDQWTRCGLTRAAWVSVREALQATLAPALRDAYAKANAWLAHNGVDAVQDLKVKRVGGGQGLGAVAVPSSAPAPLGAPSVSGSATDRPAASQPGLGGASRLATPEAGGSGWRVGARNGAGTSPSTAVSAQAESAGGGADAVGLPPEVGGDGGAAPAAPMSALERIRHRALNVASQLKRLLSDRGIDLEVPPAVDRPAGPSPALAQAMSQQAALWQSGLGGVTAVATSMATVRHSVSTHAVIPLDVQAAAQDVHGAAQALRDQSNELKNKANTPSEKAIIEIVALMFQSILAEERIPPTVRVLFARLQIPVLRVALSEPEFFSTMQHPARRLLDQMGSCVLGFDASKPEGGRLETEIRRIVQVIEQYPDTGRRVFQLVYDEFRKFLDGFLINKDSTRQVVSVAQQMEQKETLAIQYTIEFRNMLADIPVREEIRDFLFKVWAEALALAAVRNGPQHPDTLALKQSAADLVWAASAKPSRAERSKVIEGLPALLQRLRQGMGVLGLSSEEQESRIKAIGEALADAFMSRTESIPQERIDELARRLANLENVVVDEGTGDLPLDAESIEMLVGIEASSLEVVTDGGVRPNHAMKAWAKELQPGAWFVLDHNGQKSQVQFVWRSAREHLNLFASADGRNYLIQARRLAAYLQAGLLVPSEEESLTVRATRDALAKLDANPERLMA